jgi:hypothetical protein
VVIGVRADFYGEISADAQLAGAVANNQVLLGPMQDDDLRRAIAEPARLAGLRLEPGLIDLVLRDVAGESGALPLMSHALRETWERRDGRTLTVEASGEAVRALLERLAEARLVTLDEGTVELAHEVLIRRWPALRRWLEEDREGIRLHRRLSDAARFWEAAGRESADLYRGARLDAAVEWGRTNGALLNETERDFLTASAEESARTLRGQVKTNRRLRRALSVSGALLVAALALLAFALVSRRDAVRAGASARSQAVAAEAETQVARDPQRALLLARAALKLAPTSQAQLRPLLVSRLRRQPGTQVSPPLPAADADRD